MIKIDWSYAPDKATHVLTFKGFGDYWFYKIEQNMLWWYGKDEVWRWSAYPVKFLLEGGEALQIFIPRIKPRLTFNSSGVPILYDLSDPLTRTFIKAIS